MFNLIKYLTSISKKKKNHTKYKYMFEEHRCYKLFFFFFSG